MIQEEKKAIKKQAHEISAAVLPQLTGLTLRDARDKFLTNCCPPALFPHYHAGPNANKIPVSPIDFVITNPHSLSMKLTASNRKHHHRSKAENYL